MLLSHFCANPHATFPGEFLIQIEEKIVETDYYAELIDKRLRVERDLVEKEDEEEEIAEDKDTANILASQRTITDVEDEVNFEYLF